MIWDEEDNEDPYAEQRVDEYGEILWKKKRKKRKERRILFL